MTKEELLTAIRTLPNGYQEFLDTALPGPPSMPSDTDTAQKQVGQCAQYITNILSTYAGLHLLKIPYLMGQGNEAILGLLLASLEIAAITGSLTILPLFPLDGKIYYAEDTLLCVCKFAGDITQIDTAFVDYHTECIQLTQGQIDPSNWYAELEPHIGEGDIWEDSLTFSVSPVSGYAGDPIDPVTVNFSLSTDPVYQDPTYSEETGGGSGGGGASGGW